jgi:hypothetical protein
MPSNTGNGWAHVYECEVRSWRRSDSKRQSRRRRCGGGGRNGLKADGWGWDWRRSVNGSGSKRRARELGLVLK